MAKELQSISLGAAGFLGVNTMDPPLQQSLDFADTANNAVIDQYGRLGARKGFSPLTVDNSALGGEVVRRIAQWQDDNGDTYVFVMTYDSIFRAGPGPDYTTLTAMDLPMGYTITGDDWSTADFNGALYFFQLGHEPLMVNTSLNTAGDLDTVDNVSAESVPDAPEGNVVVAAYGRLWTGGVDGNESTVYWSDTLIGSGWTEGASGSINLTTVWPNGYDKLVGIAAHNERIIFFGRNSILVYTGATDPATMALEDAVSGAGCSFRDSIVHTGDDILFCSQTGIKSLGRTVLQNTMPITDLTKNVRNQIQTDIKNNVGSVQAVYSPEESFYLITFPGAAKTYCVDMKDSLDDGARRVTVWPNSPFYSFARGDEGTLFIGGSAGLGEYTGYSDDGEQYRFQYYGPGLDFGDVSRIKVLKKMIVTMVGGLGRPATLSWGYGYSGSYKSEVTTLANSLAAEYGVSEYNTGYEWSGGSTSSDSTANTTGSGPIVRVGVGVDINGSAFSLQQIRVHVIMGKIV